MLGPADTEALVVQTTSKQKVPCGTEGSIAGIWKAGIGLGTSCVVICPWVNRNRERRSFDPDMRMLRHRRCFERAVLVKNVLV